MASPGTYKGVQIDAGTDSQVSDQISKIDSATPPTIQAAAIGRINPVKIPDIAVVPAPRAIVPPPSGTISDSTTGMASPAPQEDTSVGDYIKEQFKGLGDALGQKAAVTENFQNEQQLSKKTEQAAKDYNAYQAAKVNLDQEIEKMQTANPSGKSEAARQADISEYTRRGNADLANLAIQANASQGLLTAAEKTIKDKVEAQFQPITDQLDYLTKFSQINANDLTESQKLRLAEKAKQVESDRDLVQKAASDLHAALLQNNAPASVYSNMDRVTNDFISGKINASEAETKLYQAAGQYGVDVYKQAQLNNINTEITKRNAETNNLNTPLVTNPAAGDYSAALSIILGSSKFTKDQKSSVINSINSGEDPFTVVTNQAKNIMGQTEATKVTNFEIARDQVKDLGTALKSFYANGGNTGYLSGSYENVINKLGEVSDPKLVELAVQISSSLQQYRNAVSGTAYSVQEGKDISAIFPGINKTEGLNDAILRGRLASFDSTIDAAYRSALGKTYDDLKGKTSQVSVQNDPLQFGITPFSTKNNSLGI